MAEDKEVGGVTIGNVEGGIRDAIIAGGDVHVGSPRPDDRPEPQAPHSGTVTGTNIATVRQLLLAAFTPQTLRRFCQDRPIFRSIVAEFGPGQGLGGMVDCVIDYCEARLLFDELLAEVKNENPRQYFHFESDL